MKTGAVVSLNVAAWGLTGPAGGIPVTAFTLGTAGATSYHSRSAQYEAATGEKMTAREAVPIVAGDVSGGSAAYTTVSGTDPLTGEKVSTADRIESAAHLGVAIGVGAGTAKVTGKYGSGFRQWAGENSPSLTGKGGNQGTGTTETQVAREKAGAENAPLEQTTDATTEYMYGPKNDPKVNPDGSTSGRTWTTPEKISNANDAALKLDTFKEVEGRRPVNIPKGTEVQRGTVPGKQSLLHNKNAPGGASETLAPRGLPPGSVGPWKPLPAGPTPPAQPIFQPEQRERSDK